MEAALRSDHDFNSHSDLTAAAECLRTNGHVLMRGLVEDDELVSPRNAILGAMKRHANEERDIESRDTYSKAFLQVTNLWEKDERVKRFVFERRFAEIAADLLGVEKVRLYHDQALFKVPGGGHTPWHQDKFYWPLDTDNMITMWMPLVDVDEKMGLIRFASGSHLSGAVENLEISDESEDFFARYLDRTSFPVEGPGHMKAGDATFHLGWTVHSAGANRSEKMREVMTVIYFADGARITEPKSNYQQADLDAWFPGQKAGDIAASPLNPVLN